VHSIEKTLIFKTFGSEDLLSEENERGPSAVPRAGPVSPEQQCIRRQGMAGLAVGPSAELQFWAQVTSPPDAFNLCVLASFRGKERPLGL